ncbi:phosphotransferase family protein [Dermacoccaceae bacterium W4C1]
MNALIPERVEHHDAVVNLKRAWPLEVAPGSWTVAFEGRDGSGQLRAGQLTVTRADAREGQSHDGAHQTSGVQLLKPGIDPALPGLPALEPADVSPGPAAEPGSSVELLVHRAGRRAVCRTAEGYLKVVRPKRAAQTLAAGVQGHAFAQRAGIAAPQLSDLGQGRLLAPALPGVSLHTWGREATASQWRGGVRDFLDSWAKVTAQPVQGLTVHTGSDEVELTRTWVARAACLRIPGADALNAACDQLARQLSAPGAAPVPTHRDLHDQQVLLDVNAVGEGIGVAVIDLDTLCAADRELDLANLVEHAWLRVRQGWWGIDRATDVEAAIAAHLDGIGGEVDRWNTYRQLTRFRLAGLYLFRPRWAEMARSWIADLGHGDEDENVLIRASSHRHLGV